MIIPPIQPWFYAMPSIWDDEKKDKNDKDSDEPMGILDIAVLIFFGILFLFMLGMLVYAGCLTFTTMY